VSSARTRALYRALSPLLVFCAVTIAGSGTPGAEATADAASARSTAAPRASKALKAFGKVVWQGRVLVGSAQNACVGDQFFGPGAAIEFGIVEGRYRDRLYFRTDRKIIREWEIPARGQPDSAVAWANRFLSRFAVEDTLFAELHDTGEPVVATGPTAVRMANLFRRWVQDSFTPADWKEAAELGIPAERLTGPPPERICAIGAG
jgi:hypothetical protein